MDPKQPPPADNSDDSKPVVLVVDDDRSHRKLFELLSRRLDITAHMTESCDEALESLDLFAFDIILMDCRMPGTDGFVCTQKIRTLFETTRHIPIIAVTGQTEKGMRQRCLNAGMDDYLGKPFTLEELHEKLALWLPQKEV